MGQREVQVGRLVRLDELELLDDVAHLHRVGVCQHHALGRPGGARRVDDDPGVVALDLVLAARELGPIAGRASLPQLVKRHVARALLDPDHVLELRELVADLIDLPALAFVLDDDRLGA